MAPTIGRHPSTLLRTLLPASLLSLAACGPAVEEAQQPVITSKHELTGTWRQDGLLQGGAGGTSSATMTLAATGDENGDGVDDLALGLPLKRLSTTVQGQVMILSGANLATIKTINNNTNEAFGYGVASLGDINGDGRIDYGVGVPVTQDAAGQKTYKGRTHILRSKNSSYTATIVNDALTDGYFGRSVAYVGGTNGVLVSARPRFMGGRALGIATKNTTSVVYTASEDALNNDTVNERRGYSIAAISDMNGDGVKDFVMHASGQDPAGAATFAYPGRVYFHSGATGALLRVVEGSTADMQLGGASSEIDDINGDGVNDYLIGASYYDAGGVNMEGAAFVVDGALVRTFPTKLLSLSANPQAVLRTHAGSASIALTGYATSNLFDLNGDGVDEYAIGAPGVTLGTLSNAGQVSIHDGATGAQVSVLNGTASGQWFGEGLLADPKSKALYVATWHADAYNGRVYLYRWVP